jgi:glutathione S-transferase
MKLYNMNLSNFATKCRIVIYEKNIPVEMVATPAPDEYKKINPLGKIPALDIGTMMIPESEVINEYLEEKYPTPALMPKTPEARAVVRIFTRFHDLYLEPPLRALFPQLAAKEKDQKLIADKLAEIGGRLDLLEQHLAAEGFAAGEFSMADCAIAPTMFFMVNMLGAFGGKSPLEGRPKLTRWWNHVQTRPSVKKALTEQAEALAAMQRGAR